MIALIQRVSGARVAVAGREIGTIGTGILALVGVRREDNDTAAARLAQRILAYRIFPDKAGRMNRSIREVQGGLLLVPQFTLAADTRSGTRPGFSTAAEPASAQNLFNALVAAVESTAPELVLATGQFGAHMQVSLTNDGPVTFWLES